MLRNKLKVGLKSHLDKLTQMINCENDIVEEEGEFKITFEYVEYLLGQNINDTNAFKNEDPKNKQQHLEETRNRKNKKSNKTIKRDARKEKEAVISY
jgi:hypothetical protein